MRNRSVINNKVFNILVLLAIGLLVSCENINKKKESPKRLGKVINEYIDSLNYFDESCLIDLEKAFIKYNVWGENARLIEGAKFFPNRDNRLNVDSYDKFISLLFETGEDLICEMYLYSNYWNDFIPIRMEDEGLVLDSLFLVRLHFEGEGIKCGDLYLKGSKDEDLKKNGIFKKQDED